jgi:hypothetical protein
VALFVDAVHREVLAEMAVAVRAIVLLASEASLSRQRLTFAAWLVLWQEDVVSLSV